MIPDRLKKIIFRKLYNDLSHVEIIPFNNSIWFVDRDEKYWYFELQKDGTLWWRYQFFSDFFILFSLERDDYQSILARWVEEVLNSRVYTTASNFFIPTNKVEEVLNSRVYTTMHHKWGTGLPVEEVLNSRVNKTFGFNDHPIQGVEDVLKSRVDTTFNCRQIVDSSVKDVLKSRVLRTQIALHSTSVMAEDVLNCGDNASTIGERLNHKVSQAKEGELKDETIVDTVLSSIRSV
jgi:hypothetical protein